MLRCFDGSFYTGVTNNMERRYNEHCFGADPHCYTYMRRPLRLVYVGEFQRVADAIAFEKQLKGWTHIKKRAFAQGDFALVNRLSCAHPCHPERSEAQSKDRQ
jgi:putative endonuclease